VLQGAAVAGDPFEPELAAAAAGVPEREALDVLDELGVKTCVASSGTHERMRYTLGRTGLYRRFEGRIFSGAEVANGKPAPDLFLHAAERLGVEPAACAVVEDSRAGLEAARAAGMRAFAYAGGLIPAHLLHGPGTVVFDDMRELPRLLTEASEAVGRRVTRGR
jgi:HAD superfamily hydrolase (TIGR01509 family)